MFISMFISMYNSQMVKYCKPPLVQRCLNAVPTRETLAQH